MVVQKQIDSRFPSEEKRTDETLPKGITRSDLAGIAERLAPNGHYLNWKGPDEFMHHTDPFLSSGRIGEAATFIADTLGELGPCAFLRVVAVIEELGVEQASMLVQRARHIQTEESPLIADASRPRTLGGIFFLLAKEHATDEQKKRLTKRISQKGGTNCERAVRLLSQIASRANDVASRLTNDCRESRISIRAGYLAITQMLAEVDRLLTRGQKPVLICPVSPCARSI